MNNTSAANSSSKNASGSSMIVPSKAEGIAWCSAFILTSVFIVVGNSLTIFLFAANKRLRKKSLFLVINMAFADLMVGALSLPCYIYAKIGADFHLWTGSINLYILDFFTIVDDVTMVASLISAAFISCERFYAIYWPLKHRTLSMRPYCIVIFMVWTLALFDTGLIFLIPYHYKYAWMSYGLFLTFIICGCNIGIWRKFQHGGVASQQQNRASQNKRLTKTLLFISILDLLSWLPLIIIEGLTAFDVSIPWRYYVIASILNYSNSFVNPIIYALRIPEFRQALGLCCYRRQAAMNMEHIERRNNRAAVMTPIAKLTQTDPIQLQPAFEQEAMDTKL